MGGAAVIATPSGRLSTAGKQVLLDGTHLCDAKDDVTAEGIALALDFVGVDFFGIPPEAKRKILQVLT